MNYCLLKTIFALRAAFRSLFTFETVALPTNKCQFHQHFMSNFFIQSNLSKATWLGIPKLQPFLKDCRRCSEIPYTRGLKLRVTRGPHETQRKVSRAALKKVKKITFKFSSKSLK